MDRLARAIQDHVVDIGFDHSATTCGPGCAAYIWDRYLNTPIDKLARYRQKHVIRPMTYFGLATATYCRHDQIKILPKVGNVGRSPWRHDPAEIRALSDQGEPDWPTKTSSPAR